MAWQISDKTNELLRQLHDLQSPPRLFRRRGRDDHAVEVLEQVAARDEPATISAVARCLIHQSADVRDAANRGVHRLMTQIPPEELLHVSEVIGWSWGWYISDAWEKLAPRKVESLITKESARPSVPGIASFHHNGYVRHEAVRLLTENRDGHELAYLLIRQNDWVEPKGYHSEESLDCLQNESHQRTYIPEPQRKTNRRWKNKPPRREAAYRRNRRNVKGERGRWLQRLRSERVERTFAHLCDTGGARRSWLRGLEKVRKRYLAAATAFNLARIMRSLLGAGKPKHLAALAERLCLAYSTLPRRIRTSLALHRRTRMLDHAKFALAQFSAV